MKIQGKLFLIKDTQKVSNKFSKREFVLEYADNPMYPQFIEFQFTQKNCDKLDGYKAGQMVEIEFNLRGREWISPQGEKKYFNSLEAWKINKLEAVAAEVKQPELTLEDLEEGDDDMPF